LSNTAFDIIGDIHGCAQTLEKLLLKLQYRKKTFDHGREAYWHPERKVIFVGDIVDRGPNIREALHLVKNMSDAGTAMCVMGNHEYNALAYSTEAPEESGRAFVRDHSPRHSRVIAETLEQFEEYPIEWHMFLEWFQSLPVFLEFPSFRVVHACWDQGLIDTYKSLYGSNRVSREFIQQSWNPKSFASTFFDRLTQGTTLDLPSGRIIDSKDGYKRRRFRTKFWSQTPQTYQDVVFQPDPLPEDLAKREISELEQSKLLNYKSDEVPVFIGHYWLEGKPSPIKDNVACLDYSAVKYGRLAAYRFDGEQVLQPDKFVWVYVDPER